MSAANGSTPAPPVPNKQLATIKGLIDMKKDSIAEMLPRHLSVERLTKVALNCIAKVADLQNCTASSLLQCVISAAELGLEPGGALGHAYLVPFKDKHSGQLICTLIIGYRGFIDLARRSGQLAQIEAHVVHEKDVFELEFGLTPKLRHIPKYDGDPGKATHAYCIARMRDGSVHVEVMGISEVNKIRARSRSKDYGPWVTDYEEMAKKTAVRRAAKWLPLSPELARAIEHDDQDFIEAEANEVDRPMFPAETALAEEIVSPTAARAKETVKAKRQQAKLPETTATPASRIIDVPTGMSEEEALSLQNQEPPPDMTLPGQALP